jgi:ribosome-associated toxin RatA of RatAB toxin-antitoxin module
MQIQKLVFFLFLFFMIELFCCVIFVEFRYSPEQLFDVVAAVDLYHGFVPWCQRSEILKQYPDGSFDAELEIGFKFLVESYVSHVELNRPKFLKVNTSASWCEICI